MVRAFSPPLSWRAIFFPSSSMVRVVPEGMVRVTFCLPGSSYRCSSVPLGILMVKS